MARKRLTPALREPATEHGAPEVKAYGFARTQVRSSPPIAHVAREAAAEAALDGLAAEVEAVRSQGRMVQALPLDAVDEGHLVRDRLSADDNEMAALKASIAERGQQVAIEVVDLGEDRFGLLSGWRRLTALRALRDETGEARFGTVLALLRRPENAAEAYRAMVEENELRVGLSHWERARIAAQAAERRVYPSAREAIRGLFGTASRSKQSKIGSFLTLYEALDGALAYPAAIPERLGLALAAAIEGDPGLAPRLRDALRKAPAASAEVERQALQRALARKNRNAPAAAASQEITPGIRLQMRQMRDGARVTLTGPGVTAGLAEELGRWLAGR